MGSFCVTILQFLLRWVYGLRPHQALSCLGAITNTSFDAKLVTKTNNFTVKVLVLVTSLVLHLNNHCPLTSSSVEMNILS